MTFNGPGAHDFANVFSLNATLLEVLVDTPGVLSMPVTLAERLECLSGDERTRLARTPVLLLSVAEQDLMRWAPVYDSPPRRDLVSDMQRPPARMAELAAATLGFLWQLACRDTYAARVISGASAAWCDKLAGSLLLDVLEFGAREPGLLTLRFADQPAVWQKLLTAGTSDDADVRLAARLSALQNFLTRCARPAQLPLRAAACAISRSTLLAERKERPPP